VGEWPPGLVGILLALVTVTLALLARRPRHAVTWVLVVYTATNLSFLVDDQGRLWAVWGAMGLLVLLAFPDGVRTSRPRQLGFWLIVATFAIVGGLSYLPPVSAGEDLPPLVSALLVGMSVSCLLIGAAAVVSLARASTRSEGLRRARLAVFLSGVVLVVLLLAVSLISSTWQDSAPGDVSGAAGGAALAVLPFAVGVSMLLEPPSGRMRWLDRIWPWVLAASAGLVIGGTVYQVRVPDYIRSESGGAGEWVAGLAGATSAIVVAAVAVAVRPSRSRVPTAGERASMGLRDLADRLAAAPRPEEVPPLVARAVGQALDLAGTAVDVRTPEGSERLAVVTREVVVSWRVG
jgi:hypothetical protein